jgi:hypothetical protein
MAATPSDRRRGLLAVPGVGPPSSHATAPRSCARSERSDHDDDPTAVAQPPRVKTTPPPARRARPRARLALVLRLEGRRRAAAAHQGRRDRLPHTTNWDLPFMLAIAYRSASAVVARQAPDLPRPFGGFMRWLGGIPVDRSAHEHGAAGGRAFRRRRPALPRDPAVGDAPQGGALEVGLLPHRARRRRADPLHVPRLHAQGRRHRLPVEPTGDVRADMDKIRAFYVGIEGRYPENQTPIYLPEEDQPLPRAASGGTHKAP